MKRDFLAETSRGNTLRISSFGTESIKRAPCIIIVHGFKGFKDWGGFPYAAEYFADSGFFVITFNFSHNGVGESLTDFDELDKFAENTFSLEIEEVTEVVGLYRDGFFGETDNDKIFLLGHSRGGAIAILSAARMEEIAGVASWASVADFDRYSERQKEKWRREGKFEILNQRTKQVMRLNITLLDDLEANKNDLLNIEQGVKNLRKPFLIAHGEEDLAVPVKEGETIYGWADESTTEFMKIPRTGHTFGIKHPFEGSNPVFDSLLETTKEFFLNNT